jgi:hypothetical protein
MDRSPRPPRINKNRPWYKGAGGFYLSAGGNNKLPRHCLAHCPPRHIVPPVDKDDSNEDKCRNKSRAYDDIVLGINAFNEKLAAINGEIRGQGSAVIDADNRIKSIKDKDNPALVTGQGA